MNMKTIKICGNYGKPLAPDTLLGLCPEYMMKAGLGLCAQGHDSRGRRRPRGGAIASAIFPSGFCRAPPLISATMFDMLTAEISTAAEKLTHLRRFL